MVMDIKVNQVSQVVQPEAAAPVREADGNFKFTLVSHVEEQELQARLTTLMEEITMQGDKLVMDTLGQHVSSQYIAGKEAEWDEYRTRVSSWERDKYIINY